jgi:saccharopine dehydrogenase-like NADP-dependent oxidoreductase
MIPDIRNFQVSVKADWKPVVDYLLQRATSEPLPYREKDIYSKSNEEAWAKGERLIAAGRAAEATRFSCTVEYQRFASIHTTMLSLVLTREPGVLHLSMLEVVPGVCTKAVPDALAHEAAREILGKYEERQEAKMAGVRHFYQTIM